MAEEDWEVNEMEAELGLDSDDLRGSMAVMGSMSDASMSLGQSFASTLEPQGFDGGRWELESSEVEMGRELGSGAFGTVFKGKMRGKAVAIKKLNVQQFDDETLASFKQEVAVMSKLRHPNIVSFLGACFEPGEYMMVTELMARGSLWDLLHDEKVNLSFKKRMKMAKDAALGMNWLHCSKPPFIHRDLKTQNLLVDENFTVKVADFGLAHMKRHGEEGERGNYGTIGTPLWMAPEVLKKEEYDESADMYSFAIVLWELLTQKDPFPEVDSWANLIEVVVTQEQRPEIPKECPTRLRKLITACWAQDPASRPTFEQIIPQFDQIIVDAIIHDDHGRKIWKKYFMKDKLREVVSWKNFVIALTSFYKERVPRDPSDTRWKCLKAVVADDNEKVSIESFSRVLDWFGPMSGLSILDDIQDLLKKDWFHGEISSQTAEKRLGKGKKGTFLVRFSARDPGCFAISVVSQGGRLKHYRIYHKPGLDYLIGKTECSSLNEIVTKYHKDLFLKTACPGSPFTDIFDVRKNVSAGYLVPDFDK